MRETDSSGLMEEHTVKKKIGIGIATLGIIILCILLNLFVIGEPIDGEQLAYNITQNDSTLELQVSAKESAVVSFLFSKGQYQTSIDIDGIENVYLGGQMIWNSK